MQSGELLIISKTNRQSTVHRRVRMDDIAVKKVEPHRADHRRDPAARPVHLDGLHGAGRPHAAPAPQAAPDPAAEDLIAGSHDYKAIVAIFESFPRDELFQARADELRRQVMAVLGAEESKSVTLPCASTPTGRNVSVLIAMPRDRFNVGLRERLQALLLERYGGNSIDYHLSLGEMELAELFFTIHVGERGVPEVSFEQLEADIVAACRSWDDELADLLVARYGDARGRALARRYGRRFPDYYKSATSSDAALRTSRRSRSAGRRAVRDQAAERAAERWPRAPRR